MTAPNLSRGEMREIAGRARTLRDRLSGPSNISKEDAIDSDVFVSRWKDIYTHKIGLDRRLAEEQVDYETMRRQIVSNTWPDNHPLPDWTRTLEEIITYVNNFDFEAKSISSQLLDKPFGHIYYAILTYSKNKILKSDYVTEDAISGLTSLLTDRLSILMTDTLFKEFESFIESNDYKGEVDSSNVCYNKFVSAVLSHGLGNLCKRYPVLARLLAVITDQWVTTINEFFSRLDSDINEIMSKFEIKFEDPVVSFAEPLTRDTHDGGQVPIRVRFADGNDVIYKPRDMSPEKAFYRIITRISNGLDMPEFRSVEVLAKNNYGWMEFIEHSEPESEKAINKYYRYIGFILCIAYLFHLDDCHYENVISNGKYPVIVDIENILHPPLDPALMPSPTGTTTKLQQSVLSTDLLPWTYTDPRFPKTGWSHDDMTTAGIGSTNKQCLTGNKTIYKNVNTDRMYSETGNSSIGKRFNTVKYNGDNKPPEQYINDIIAGFEDTYDCISSFHKNDAFLEDICDSAMSDIYPVQNRVIYRHTEQYMDMIKKISSPARLTNGIYVSLLLEGLSTPFFNGRTANKSHFDIVKHEKASLECFDIPRFHSEVKSNFIYPSGSEKAIIESTHTGYQVLTNRLNNMSLENKQHHLSVIKECYQKSDSVREFDRNYDKNTNNKEIATDMLNTVTASESHGWCSVRRNGSNSGLTFVPTADSLYNGRTGIAFALAACYKVTGDDRYLTLSSNTIQPIIEGYGDERNRYHHGGLFGIGSIIYGLSSLSVLLDSGEYASHATKLVSCLNDDFITSAKYVGIPRGIAGTLIGLVKCYRVTGSQTVSDRILSCVEELSSRSIMKEGSKVSTHKSTHMAGYGYGAEAVGYALISAGEATNNSSITSLGIQKILNESNQKGSDPFGRVVSTVGSSIILRETDPDFIRLAEESAANCLLNHDQLDCGKIGFYDLLLELEKYSFSDQYELLTPKHAEESGVNPVRQRTLKFDQHVNSFTRPGLFSGLCGASYSLIRSEDSVNVPSVVLLQ